MKARSQDAAALADIRNEAMQPSLEAVGRYHPTRVRERFLSSFIAAETQLILRDDDLAGFFVVRLRPDHLWLDHLYLKTRAQGLGLGKRVVEHVQHQAIQLSLPVRLMALKDSPANGFYTALGFSHVAEEEFDQYYQWLPGAL